MCSTGEIPVKTGEKNGEFFEKRGFGKNGLEYETVYGHMSETAQHNGSF
jgi:hypothetical protein